MKDRKTSPQSGEHKQEQPPRAAAPQRKVLEQLYSFTVPAKHRHRLLAEDGRVLRALEQQHQMYVKLDRRSGFLTLQGPSANVNRCHAHVTALFAKWDSQPTPSSPSSPSTSSKPPSGSTQDTGAKRQRDPASQTPTRQEAVFSCTIHVPAPYRRRIMGEQGCIISSLRTEHQVQISYNRRDGEMSLRGPAERVKRCRDDVNRTVYKWQRWDRCVAEREDRTKNEDHGQSIHVHVNIKGGTDDENVTAAQKAQIRERKSSLSQSGEHKQEQQPRSAAQQCKVLEQLYSFTVPAKHRHRLLAEDGRVLRALEQRHQMHVKLDGRSGFTTLQGPSANVNRCHAHVTALFAKWDSQPTPSSHSSPSTSSKPPIGNTQDTGAKRQRDPAPQTPARHEAVFSCTIHVPAPYRRRIMGEQGCIISSLRTEHQVQISYNRRDGEMSLRGPAERVKRCRDDVNRTVYKWQQLQSDGQPQRGGVH